MVYVSTVALRMEETIRRAIKSILTQTHTDFCYTINTTDETESFVRECVAGDARVQIINWRTFESYAGASRAGELEFLKQINGIENASDDDLYCSLDADDEYMPNFLEDALAFREKHGCDIVACGSEIIREETKDIVRHRQVEHDIIIQDAGFSDFFPVYHQYMRVVWGKLIPVRIFCGVEWERMYKLLEKISYGFDTICTMNFFAKAQKIGIMRGVHHKYYMQPGTSSSYKWNELRIVSDRVQDDETHRYLMEKCGYVAPRNQVVLNNVYFHAMSDAMAVLMHVSMTPSERLRWVHELFVNDKARRVMQWEGVETEQSRLFKVVFDWISAQYNVKASKHRVDDEMLTELEISKKIALGTPDAEMFKFLLELKKKRPGVSEKIDIDATILEITLKHPLLTGMDAKSAIYLRDAVCAIMDDDLQTALDEVVRLSNEKVPAEYQESYLMFAQYVCASVEYIEGWLFFKKLYAQFLIDNSREDEARVAIDELEQLMPGDSEVLGLQQALEENVNEIYASKEENT